MDTDRHSPPSLRLVYVISAVIVLAVLVFVGSGIYRAYRFTTLYGPAEQAVEPAQKLANALTDYRKKHPDTVINKKLIDALCSNPELASLKLYPIYVSHQRPNVVTLVINEMFAILITESDQGVFWAGITNSPYRYSRAHILESINSSPLRYIFIPRVNIDQPSISASLKEIERLSAQHDREGKGVKFRIPERYAARFASVDTEPFHIELGPNISLTLVMTEIELPKGWMFFPVGEREFDLIPVEALVIDVERE